MNRIVLIFLVLFSFSFTGFATHNRAGEITYKHISGFTYEITVTTYTNELSVAADRCELTVVFGDGTSQDVQRTNGVPCPGPGGCSKCGESVGSNNTKMNKYVVTHTYPGNGQYRISMEDPNRNEGVLNIPNSVQVVFYIYAELYIFADGVPNSSPFLSNPPVDDGCIRIPYKHNPGAVDNDIANNGLSDSLSYKLVACYGGGGVQIPNYSSPDQWPAGPNNNISIDPITGTLLWDSPQRVGEYNVAILIEEWRKINNTVVKVGAVLRDLQITIDDCIQNNPPEIQPVSDTCVDAGTLFTKDITAIDNDRNPPSFSNFQEVTLSATGDPFYVQGNKATFPSKKGIRVVTQEFKWAPSCTQIRAYPYFVVFRAEDDAPVVHLTDYYDWRISVVAPAPENVNADPIGAGINVTWSYGQCTNATGYKVYRNIDSVGYVAPACDVGLPGNIGYSLIGTITDGNTTNFFDNDGGLGLISGQRYCYIVVAVFEDGAESYPSEEACATLLKEVPIITRVSVNTTDAVNGSDTIKWAKPTELDLAKFPGPYQYKIYRSENNSGFVEIAQTPFDFDLNAIDTVFVDTGINTLENKYTYRVIVFNGNEEIGPSRPASSPWLKPKPLDNRMGLSLDIDVPWTNDSMRVYRQQTNGNFALIGVSTDMTYTDSNLVNGQEYCYYITTSGGYSDPELEFPLLNNSQILCATPIDKQAPCPPPNLIVDSECELFSNDLSWLNPNDVCDTTDDVISYNIYYAATNTDSLEIIDQILGATNTSISYSDLFSVAGCYAVTAVDSFQNESPKSNIVCVDNCPYYELPNIFTPGDDGENDFFIPYSGYRYVQSVELDLYNRWGELVYSSTDPALGWDGNSTQGAPYLSGTYFYVCTVYEIRLSGIVPRVLKGTLTLQRENDQGSKN